MIKKLLKYSQNKQEGFSLLEMLLVVGVSSIVLVGSINLADTWARQIADVGEAEYLETVIDAAEDYVRSNFADIWTVAMGESFNDLNGDGAFTNAGDILNLGRVIRIGINAPSVGQTYFLMDASGSLPLNFPLQSPLKFEPRVYVRNMGYVSEVRTLELFVITQSINGNLLSVSRAESIASSIGPEAAAVSRLDKQTVTIFGGGFCGAGSIIRSLYGTWDVDIGTLNPPFATNVDNGYCPAVQPDALTGQGAYVALRRTVDFEDEILADVLYRVPISGRPEANRMQANLDMNSLAILNTNNVTADNINIGGNFTVSSNGATYIEETARVLGTGNTVTAFPVTTTGVPDINCNWITDGFGNTILNPAAGPDCAALNGGSFAITSGTNVAGVAQDTLVASSLTAANSSLTAGNIIVNNNLTAGNQILVAGTATMSDVTTAGVATNTMTVTGPFTTSALQTTQMQAAGTVTSGGMIVGSFAVGNLTTDGLTATQDSSGVRGNLQNSGALNIGGALNANQAVVSTMSGCQATVIHRFDLDADRNYYEIPGDFETGIPSYDCVAGP